MPGALTDHRPWPPPDRPWILSQIWCDLLFAHWPLPVADLRRAVPPQFDLDLWSGEAWIGVVPFRMQGIHFRGLLPVPGFSSTPEINVRTYVTIGGKPGVYFFSLDAANRAAVRVARRFFHLPYYWARMDLRRHGETIHYESCRRERHAPPAEFRARYRPSGAIAPAQAGTFEHWLTERYCFYTLDSDDAVVRGEILHDPWPLQPAEALIEANTMTAPFDLRLPDIAPIAHFARRLEVVAWTPARC